MSRNIQATACLQKKNREELLIFYAFSAAHWQSLQATNPIESTFSTIRHRTKQTNGCLTHDDMLHMLFKLGQCAETTWHRLRGFQQSALVIGGIQAVNGIEKQISNPVTP